jgi:hypothetical protein
MAANSISNFSSIHLIPSSGQGIAIQQQIKNNKHEIAKTQKEKAEIQSEITKAQKEKAEAQKEKAEAQKQRDCYKIILDENLKIIDYSQKAIKACAESKEIIKEMIGIYETLIARNNLQQSKTKSPIVFKDINYNPPKIDFSQFDKKPLEPQESKKSFNQVTKDYKQRSYSSSIFNDWFNSLRSHSLRFFKWF